MLFFLFLDLLLHFAYCIFKCCWVYLLRSNSPLVHKTVSILTKLKLCNFAFFANSNVTKISKIPSQHSTSVKNIVNDDYLESSALIFGCGSCPKTKNNKLQSQDNFNKPKDPTDILKNKNNNPKNSNTHHTCECLFFSWHPTPAHLQGAPPNTLQN